MQGEFISVWSETWGEIWSPLLDRDEIENDIFCELYRALAPSFKTELSVEALADIIDDPNQSRVAFEKLRGSEIASEALLVRSLEEIHATLEEYGGDDLTNNYFILLEGFIKKFSLRYDLRRPCVLCPTISGMFTSLVGNLRAFARQDEHLSTLMRDFEEAVRDLRHGCTDGRIKTCLGKQFMLLEALGASDPEITKNTLGDICDELPKSNWPHATVRESLKKLYGFSSDYPGIRHAGSVKGMHRDVDMRDMLAMSILLTGFTPYLTNEISPDSVYGIAK